MAEYIEREALLLRPTSATSEDGVRKALCVHWHGFRSTRKC